MNNKEKLYLAKLAALPLDNRGPRQDLPDGQLPPPRHNPKPGQPGYGFKKAPPTDTYASLPTAKGGLANIPPRPAAHPLSKQMHGDPDPEGWKNLQARRARGMPVQPVAQYPDKGDKMLTPNTPPVLPSK